MKRLIITFVLLFVVIFVAVTAAGCGARQESVSYPGIDIGPAPEPAPMPPMEQADNAFDENASSGGGSLPDAVDRVIIRNGNLSIVVEEVVQTRDQISALADGLGGWVVTSQIHSSDEDNVWGHVTIRVPDEQFDNAVSTIRDIAEEVRSESTDSQDVTEEYVDLTARLKNAEATEQQYLALLEDAKTVEETLKVYEFLSRLRGEIEQLKGRIQYLERSAAMSLIYVEIQPVRETSLVGKGWKFSEVWRNAVRGLTTFGQWLVVAIIWILIFSPLWGGLTAWYVIRRRRRKQRQQAEKS